MDRKVDEQQHDNVQQLFCGNSQSSVDEHANVLDEIDLEDNETAARVHGFPLDENASQATSQTEPDFMLPGTSSQVTNIAHDPDDGFRNYNIKIKFITDEDDIDQSPKFAAKRYSSGPSNSNVSLSFNKLSFLSSLNESSVADIQAKDGLDVPKEIDESVFMGSMDAPENELETSKEELGDSHKSEDVLKVSEGIERHESLSDNIELPPDEDLGIGNLPILPEEDSSQILSENVDVSNNPSQLFNLNFDADSTQEDAGNVTCVCLEDDESGDDDDDGTEETSYVQSLDQPCSSKRPYEGSPTCVANKRPCRASVSYMLPSTSGETAPFETDSDSEPPVGAHLWLNQFTSWAGSDRAKCLKMLIKKCSADQIRQLLECIEPLFQRDFIKQLPKEVALQILRCLSPEDLLMAGRTSRYWRFLADDNLLWKEQCSRIGITSVSKRIRLMPITFASSWKAEYMRNKYIEHKWLTKPMSSAKILKAHDDHVITCLQFYGNVILSGSDDTTLKLWSAITGKCLRTLIGHTGGVWSSQMYKKTVISGSTDRTLRVWDADTGACLKILTGHTSTVRCMHLHEDRVVSGSRDATLRVWSVSEGQCLKVLVGHLAAVRCVQYNGKLVVSGAYDYYVKVWNPDTGECLHTLAGHTNRVYSLQFDGQHIVSGSLDTSIIVWDVTTGGIKHSLTGHQSLTSGMELRDNILVSGNADSTVKVWDIINGQCLHTLAGPNKHQSAVTCLQLNNRFVITSSDDGTVKLWDVKTGEFVRNLVTLESGGSGGVVWRIRASQTKLVCAVGSRNGTEETKLMVMNFDVPSNCQACQ